MNAFQLDELFRKAGPDQALDYLWGRLQDRDLSEDEALALLSAVHHELSTARAGDPKVYLAYSRFMESLSREMPVIHHYVIARWTESRRAARRQSRETGGAPDALDEDGQAPGQPSPQAAGAGAATVPHVLPVEGGSGEEAGEPAEAGEDQDNEGPDEAVAAREQGDEEQPEQDEEAQGQAEPESDGDQREPDDEDNEEAGELTYQEEASAALEAEVPETEAEDSDGEAEDEPESTEEPLEEDAEKEDDPEAAEAATEQPGEQEGEWPAQEEPEPAEPAEEIDEAEGDGMEGEGGEPSPVD